MRKLALAVFAGLLFCGYRETRNNGLSVVNDFAYQLQEIDLLAIGVSRFDLVIIDYSPDGSEESRFTPEDIGELQQSPGGAKIVLAYISVGQAEDFRWYWNEAWDADADGVPDAGAPEWLGTADPDWPGCYEVEYWHPEWQAILRSYLDTIIAAGFDGVYLDGVDAYEYWSASDSSTPQRVTAEQDMVRLVLGLADHARRERGVPDFIVIPQGGEKLCAHREYLRAVDGIGREDVWYFDDEPVPPEERESVTASLDRFREAGKIVLVTDYVRKPAGIDDFYACARARGYVPYATVRELDSLTINPGHEPD